MTREQYDKLTGDRLTEDAWREQIRRYAYSCGFTLHYHTYRSDRSEPGFPDDVFIHRSGSRLIFIEGKRESGRLSADQVVWLDGLTLFADKTSAYGLEVYVVRPSDRDGLWAALSFDMAGGHLHQWCLDDSCERCSRDRARATPHQLPRRKGNR